MKKIMEPIIVLKKSRRLISAPQNWTKGVYARDANGKEASATSPSAKSFCIIGAINKVVERGTVNAAAHNALINAMPGTYPTITQFNDAEETTHADIIAVIDAAIESIQERTLWGRLKTSIRSFL